MHLLILLVWAVPGLVYAGQKPVIESISGEKPLKILRGGSTVDAHEGEELQPGDRIQTGANTSTRIVYEDGTQMAVGRGTELEVQAKEGSTNWNRLHSGQVWGLVQKPKALNKADRGKYRYGVRTQSAVMGVRGTEFVVSQEPGQNEAQVHGLAGQIEVAKDEKTLLAGKGLKVLKDQVVQAKPGSLQPPKKFDRQGFMGQLVQKQPDFPGFIKNPPRGHEELQKLRDQSAAATQLQQKQQTQLEQKKEEAQQKLAPPPAPEIPKEIPKSIPKKFGR